jgi:hypothetical protein
MLAKIMFPDISQEEYEGSLYDHLPPPPWLESDPPDEEDE